MSSPPPRQTSAPPLGRLQDLPPERPRSRVPEDDEPSPRVPRRLRRELITYGALLLFGLIGAPLLTWVAGNRWLGPYTHGQNLHGSPWALLQDYFLGLLHGSAVFWVVALGPAVLVLLVRLFIRLVRASGRRAGTDDDEAPIARRSRLR
jgi:hypothetical protein